MKNILLVLTGGTICCDLENGYRGLDTENSKNKLIYNFKSSNSKCKNDVNFIVENPVNVLSENMNLDTWNILISYFKNVDYKNYDGIIIAHGTDTLAYTSSLFATLLCGVSLPVIFVSANAPLNDASTNGNDNFKYAVELIYNDNLQNGVWVAYKNISNGKMNLYDGGKVKQIADFSEDLYAINQEYCMPEMLIKKVNKLRDNVMIAEPYVGLNYNNFDLSNIRVVIHGAYHSQTVETDSFKKFAKRCKDNNILILLIPFDVNKQEKYSSVDGILCENIIPINNMTKELAYCKSVVGCSLYENIDDLKRFIGC